MKLTLDAREQVLPVAMSIPEIMGDPCASEQRAHLTALVRATGHVDKLVDAFPGVDKALQALYDAVRAEAAFYTSIAAGG